MKKYLSLFTGTALLFTLNAAAAPDANLIRNGEFVEGTSQMQEHLTSGAVIQPAAAAFESAEALQLTVPAADPAGSAFLSQTLELPAQVPTRHFRVNWWMQVHELSGPGGAGAIVDCFDANGRLIASFGDKQLHNRRVEEMNEWQKIDYNKDMWWQNYSLEFKIPLNCRSLNVKLGIFNADGSISVDRWRLVNAPSVEELSLLNDPIVGVVSAEVVKPNLHELLFTANADYHHNALYYGTLPADDPASAREACAEALRDAGVRVLRFPGGMPAHEYFVEGPQYQFKTGEYPLIANVIDFCHEYGFELLFQTNDLLYVDADGNRREIFDDRWTNGTPERIGEAAEALRRFIQKVPPEKRMKYWEIGNEDFALMSVEHYAALCKAFIQVIKEARPDAVITVTGNVWAPQLAKLLQDNGAIEQVDSFAVHYPWGNHWHPENNDPALKRDLERLMMGDLDWALNIQAHEKLLSTAGAPEMRFAGSETNVFKFHVWEDAKMIYTPGQALTFAKQWIEAMKIPKLDMLAYHDLDSTYFGMLAFNIAFDPEINEFKRLPLDSGTPKKFTLFPSALMMKRLSRHIGGDVLNFELLSPRFAQLAANCDTLVTRHEDELRITVVNRAKRSREITLDIPAAAPDATAQVESLYWRTLDELPGGELVEQLTLPVNQERIQLLLPPYSVTGLTVPLKSKE